MNRQSFITILFTVLMSMTGAKAFAHDIEAAYNGKTIYYVWANNNTELAVSYRGSSWVSYNEYTGNVVVPESVDYNGNTYPVTSIGNYAFCSCNGLTSITIPNSVTSIGNFVFSGCSGLTSMTIPNSVTSIGDYAFQNCSCLTSVTIPHSVTSIGNFAFRGCSGLTSINVESGNQYYDSRNNCNAIIETASNTLIVGCKNTTIPNSVTSIGSYAFSQYSGLTSITIPNSVTSIGHSAFSDCSSLTSITIPNSVTSIGNYAFVGCSGLTSINVESGNQHYDSRNNCNAIIETASNTLIVGCKNTTIPNSVISIGRSAFSDCSSLTSITIPNSVTSINNSAFSRCSGLISINVESGNPYYDSRNNCNAIIETASNTLIVGCKNTTIPNSVTSIGSYAFSQYSGLTSITIPNSVTSIGEGAFSSCSGLTSVTIPSSVISIGNYAFVGCSGLISITSEIEEPFAINENVFSNKNALLKVPYGTKSAYQATDGWKNFENIEEMPYDPSAAPENIVFASDAVKAICVANWDTNNDGELNMAEAAAVKNLGEVFKGNTTITSFDELQYFTGLTEIAENAFQGCSALNSVIIPNSVTSIGGWAFWSCSGLTSVTIPNSVTSIGNLAFQYCSGLTSVTIPNSVTSIGNQAFYGCDGLTSVTIGNSVTSIGWGAFINCSGLTSITVESDNQHYDSRNNCNAIIETASNTLILGCKNTTIPNSVTSIGNYAFEDCSGLTSVTIPNSVTSIGGSAFTRCKGLTSVTIPNSVTSIGNGAFQSCSGLTSITISNSVTSIGSSAFYACSGLNSINVESGNQYYDSRNNCNAIIETASNTLILGCKNTTIPNNVTSIGGSAFFGCSGLTSITIPNSVTSIGEYAFSGCNSLTSITSEIEEPFAINENVFSNKNALLKVPTGTKSLYEATDGWKSFKNIVEVSSLKRTINVATAGTLSSLIPADMKYLIEELTLSGELNGTDIHFIRDMAGINMDRMKYGDYEYHPGEYAKTNGQLRFLDLSDAIIVEGGRDYYRMLTSDVRMTFDNYQYTKPNEISDHMFDSCWKLEELTLPSSVTSISSLVFGYNKIASPIHVNSIHVNIKSLKVADGNPTYESPGDCKAIIEKETNTLILGCSNSKIPENVASIGKRAFYGCGDLTSITIPNSVTSIGDDAFYSCSGLTSINVESGNQYYDSRNNCNAIIETASKKLLWGCKNTTIPISVTSIGEYAFEWCSGLTSITIPGSVTSIGYRAFYGSGLTSVIVDIQEPLAINGYTFSNQANATLYVPKGCKAAYEAADYWKDFKEIKEFAKDEEVICVLEDDNTAKVTAANDPTEKDVVIPGSVMIGEESLPVTGIGENAFKDNTNLALVCIPETIEEIGENAFAGCSGLTAIYSYSEEPIALGSSKATIRTRADGDEVSASSVFANVDKESCILYVPKNCGNKYRNAIGWGEFQNIVEMMSTKPGDANNDGNVDSLDVDATVGYIMEGKTVNFIFMNADVKTDSKINAADIVEIVNLK